MWSLHRSQALRHGNRFLISLKFEQYFVEWSVLIFPFFYHHSKAVRALYGLTCFLFLFGFGFFLVWLDLFFFAMEKMPSLKPPSSGEPLQLPLASLESAFQIHSSEQSYLAATLHYLLKAL